MTRSRRYLLASVLAVICLVFVNEGFGQALVGGQTALDNVAAAGARSPGNMVGAGVAQAVNFGNHVTVITEQTRPTSLRAETIAASLQILFDQLNQALLLFHNLILAQAGRPPEILKTRAKTMDRETLRPGFLAETISAPATFRRPQK